MQCIGEEFPQSIMERPFAVEPTGLKNRPINSWSPGIDQLVPLFDHSKFINFGHFAKNS